MIVVQVLFPSDGMSEAEFDKAMLDSVPKFEGLDGLLRKYYVSKEDRKLGGGIYLWDSKEKAQAWFNEEWTERITGIFGKPTVEYLDCKIVVDNETNVVKRQNVA